jgi:hypothetical protein
MSDVGSTDFFDRLELELRRAAQRGSRRRAGWTPAGRTVAAVVIASAVVALVLVPVLALLGSGGGDEPQRRVTVDAPPRPSPVGSVVRRYGKEHTVVATGRAPVAGQWQLEAYGDRCMAILQLDPPPGDPTDLSAGCGGESRRTPGFGRRQISVPPTKSPREIVVYGWAPERASAVVLTAGGRVRVRVRPFEGPRSVAGDFYLMAIPAELKNGRVNWLDRDGREGSGGIALLPL